MCQFAVVLNINFDILEKNNLLSMKIHQSSDIFWGLKFWKTCEIDV